MTHKMRKATLAWFIWTLSALYMFYKFVLEVSPSVMTNALMQIFDINAAQVGNFAACYFYAYLLFQIPAGLLIDKYGPRIVTTVAIGCCAVGNLLFAYSTSYPIACFSRLLIGSGAAFAVVSSFKLIANWFPFKQFALISGLLVMIAMLGAVGGQAPLAAFIQAFEWRPALTSIAIAGFILALLFGLFVRDKAPHHEERMFYQPAPPFLSGLKQLLLHNQCWWISIYSGFAFAPVMVFGGLWGVSFISQSYHLDHIVAAQSVSLLFIGFATGSPDWGWLSDRIQCRKKPMLWGTLFATICISIVIYFPGPSHALLMLMLFLFGFFISSYLLSFALIREVSGVALAATAMGFMNAFNALFGAVSDPLTGYFLDLGWDGTLLDGIRIFSLQDYRLSFLAVPICLVLSLISLFFIKETHGKPSIPSAMP